MTNKSPAFGEVGTSVTELLNSVMMTDGQPWPSTWELTFVPDFDTRIAGFEPKLLVSVPDREIEINARCRSFSHTYNVSLALMQRLKNTTEEMVDFSVLVEEAISSLEGNADVIVERQTLDPIQLQLVDLGNSPTFDFDKLREDNAAVSVIEAFYKVIV